MKSLFVLIGFITIANFSQAQLQFGAHSGYSRAWQNYGDVILPEAAVTHIHGFYAATTIDYKFKNVLSVGMEPGFARRGAACIPGWNGGINPNPIFEGDTRFKLNYIDIPVMLRANLNMFQNRLMITPSLGYGVAFLANGYEEIVNLESGDILYRGRLPIGRFSQIARFDHGAKGALNIGWNIGQHQIYAHGSFYFGLRDAERFNTSKNRAINLGLGYKFSLRSK